MTVYRTALLLSLAALSTILGAYFFEFGLGLKPCPLCLIQRIPYYAMIPLAALAAWLATRQVTLARWLLVAIVLTMVVSAGLGIYHSGVEWHFWAGPQDCAGGDAVAEITDVLKALSEEEVVRCDEAAWRFVGLSLAGWNVLISLALAILAARAAYGSNSTSQ